MARVMRERVRHQKNFSLSNYKIWRAAEKAASTWVRATVKSLPPEMPREGRMTVSNTSGVVGFHYSTHVVRRPSGRVYEYGRWTGRLPRYPNRRCRFPMTELPQFRCERLDATKHRRDEFRCESVELTTFLQQRARKEMDARASACFVLVPESDPGRIAGYYTLSQASVATVKLPADVAKRQPHYPDLGATLIGRLARDLAWKGRDIGRLLLLDAFRRSVRQSEEIGAVVVVTDPKDTNARAFYERFGFRALDESRLFIPMRELVAREAQGWTA